MLTIKKCKSKIRKIRPLPIEIAKHLPLHLCIESTDKFYRELERIEKSKK